MPGAKGKPEEKIRLPQFMQNMIEAGTLKLSEYQYTGLEQHRHPKPSLEEFRRRLREKGISVPIEEYIHAERRKRRGATAPLTIDSGR